MNDRFNTNLITCNSSITSACNCHSDVNTMIAPIWLVPQHQVDFDKAIIAICLPDNRLRCPACNFNLKFLPVLMISSSAPGRSSLAVLRCHNFPKLASASAYYFLRCPLIIPESGSAISAIKLSRRAVVASTSICVFSNVIAALIASTHIVFQLHRFYTLAYQ